MNQMSHGCGAMSKRPEKLDLTLCAPLQRLMQEHIPLWDALGDFYVMAERVVAEAGLNSTKSLPHLVEQVTTFTAQLKVHARKEDDALFPMMARYIGREAGPISVMEFEHQQAEHNLNKFLDASSGDINQIDALSAKEIAGYAIEAYNILTTHFSKEENVLFPMAESMLSDEEKALLDIEMLRLE